MTRDDVRTSVPVRGRRRRLAVAVAVGATLLPGVGTMVAPPATASPGSCPTHDPQMHFPPQGVRLYPQPDGACIFLESPTVPTMLGIWVTPANVLPTVGSTTTIQAAVSVCLYWWPSGPNWGYERVCASDPSVTLFNGTATGGLPAAPYAQQDGSVAASCPTADIDMYWTWYAAATTLLNPLAQLCFVGVGGGVTQSGAPGNAQDVRVYASVCPGLPIPGEPWTCYDLVLTTRPDTTGTTPRVTQRVTLCDRYWMSCTSEERTLP